MHAQRATSVTLVAPGFNPLPVVTALPDLGIQLGVCLENLPSPNGQALVNQVLDAIRTSLANPTADVRYACVNGTGRLGVWLTPFRSALENELRQAALAQITVLKPGETFALLIPAATIRNQAQVSFNSGPKRLAPNGTPDPNGPIHLTSLAVDFLSPNQVRTRVSGFDTRPIPDVTFEIDITDTLTPGGFAGVTCTSITDLNVDTSWLNVLTAIFLGLAAFLSPVFLAPFALFLVESVVASNASAPKEAGAGCGAVQMLPLEILLPGRLKLKIGYNRVDVSAAGITVGGQILLAKRVPFVKITGFTDVRVTGDAASLVFGVETDDLRPPLAFVWSSSVGTIENPTQANAIIQVDTSALAVNQSLAGVVHVQVTDADGLQGSQSESFIVRKIALPPPPPSNGGGDLPTDCDLDPDQPKCQIIVVKSAVAAGAR